MKIILGEILDKLLHVFAQLKFYSDFSLIPIVIDNFLYKTHVITSYNILIKLLKKNKFKL